MLISYLCFFGAMAQSLSAGVHVPPRRSEGHAIARERRARVNTEARGIRLQMTLGRPQLTRSSRNPRRPRNGYRPPKSPAWRCSEATYGGAVSLDTRGSGSLDSPSSTQSVGARLAQTETGYASELGGMYRAGHRVVRSRSVVSESETLI